jgi:hypothetical protein
MSVDWTELDSLNAEEHEAFDSIAPADYKCDYCSQRIADFPFYHFYNPSTRKCLDLCTDCWPSYKFTIACKTSARARYGRKVYCSNCNLIAETHLDVYNGDECWFKFCLKCVDSKEKFMALADGFFLKMNKNTVWCKESAVCFERPAKRLAPEELPPFTQKQVRTWAALIEDLVHWPPVLGSPKEWCVVDQEGEEKFHILNTTNLNTAVVEYNSRCHAKAKIENFKHKQE